jgi:hypothetical protein
LDALPASILSSSAVQAQPSHYRYGSGGETSDDVQKGASGLTNSTIPSAKDSVTPPLGIRKRLSTRAKGKAVDKSSAWSEFSWDDRGYWYAHRYGPTGEVEYDYRYIETTTQTEEQEQATSRTPGENILSEATSSTPTTSPEATVGQNSPTKEQNLYTTSTPIVTQTGRYDALPSWQQQFSPIGDTRYTTIGATTSGQTWNPSTPSEIRYSTTPVAEGRSDFVTSNTRAFESSPSGNEALEQTYSLFVMGSHSNEDPNAGFGSFSTCGPSSTSSYTVPSNFNSSFQSLSLSRIPGQGTMRCIRIQATNS